MNFPEVQLPRTGDYRLAVVNSNGPHMVGQISTALADSGLNIIDMLNKSRGELPYTLVDVESEITDSTIKAISAIEGVLAVRSM